MGAFFMMLLGIIWLCIVYGKENKGTREYQARVDENKSRSDKWFARVNKGPLNNRTFQLKLDSDYAFRKAVYEECNAIMDSIPAMDGIHLRDNYTYESVRLMEMMYCAKTGDISFMWFRGYAKSYEITVGLNREPSREGLAAFVAWYQSELRKNGYQGATILPVDNGYGHIIAWRFTDGASDYDMIKRDLFIN